MFTASYPASFLPEEDGSGFHVRFPDLPEALTGGDDLEDTLAQAADCLAEAIAGRIARGDEIPPPSKAKRGQRLIGVPLYLAPKLALYLAPHAEYRACPAPRRQRNGGPAHVGSEARYPAGEDSGRAGGARQAHRRDLRRWRVMGGWPGPGCSAGSCLVVCGSRRNPRGTRYTEIRGGTSWTRW